MNWEIFPICYLLIFFYDLVAITHADVYCPDPTLLPTLKRTHMCHSEICSLLKECSPKVCWSIFIILISDLSSFSQYSMQAYCSNRKDHKIVLKQRYISSPNNWIQVNNTKPTSRMTSVLSVSIQRHIHCTNNSVISRHLILICCTVKPRIKEISIGGGMSFLNPIKLSFRKEKKKTRSPHLMNIFLKPTQSTRKWSTRKYQIEKSYITFFFILRVLLEVTL